MSRVLITSLVDWILAFFVVITIMWFLFTQPVFSVQKKAINQPSVSTELLRKHVVTLIEDYSPRTVEYGNLNLTAHYIHDELKEYGKTSYQTYRTLTRSYSNVLLELGPNTEEILVIGAHYDAENNSLDTEGNASGVATLIELARVLFKAKSRLPIRVHLIAYPFSQNTSEHVEYMGSYSHAEFLKSSHTKVRLMISLDSVGRFSNEKDSQKYPLEFMNLLYPNKGNYISLIGNLKNFKEIRSFKKSFIASSSLPVRSFSPPQISNQKRFLDHINYQLHGFPAILLTDTAEYRTPQSKDVIKQLDIDSMALLVKGLYHSVMASEPSHLKENLADQNKSLVEIVRKE